MTSEPNATVAGGPLVGERRLVRSTIALVLLLAIGVVVELLLFSGLAYDLLLRFVVVAILMLTVARSNPFPLLIALMAKLLFREPGNLSVEWTTGGTLYALFALIVVATASTFQSIVIWLSDLWWEDEGEDGNWPRTRKDRLRSWSTGFGSTAFWYFAGSIGVILVARLLLARIPLGDRVGVWYRWALNNQGMIWPGPALIMVAIAVAVLLGELSWRQMTREQASMYVRSQSIRFLYPEYRSVILRTMRWQRKKKS